MGGAVQVLGIEVPASLLETWATWFAPAAQPFVIAESSPLARAGHAFDRHAHPELRDTFELYVVAPGTAVRCLTYDEFISLRQPDRAALVRQQVDRGRPLVPSVRAWPGLRGTGIAEQADGHRFVWWPSLLRGREREVLVPYVEDGRRASRHREVAAGVWADAARVLPAAQELAGSFPERSGPNCFGTVMGAAGVRGAADVWMQREPFEEWLSDTTRPGGRDDVPGTVLVWRSASGAVQHAAVTLGAGWALHKPSQGWMSPVKVLEVRDVLGSARAPDRRLSRRTMV